MVVPIHRLRRNNKHMNIIYNLNNTYKDENSSWKANLLSSIITATASIIAAKIGNSSDFDCSVRTNRCIIYIILFISIITAVFLLFSMLSFCIYQHMHLSGKSLAMLCVAFLSAFFLCMCIKDLYSTLSTTSNSSSIIYENLLYRIPFNTHTSFCE